MKTVSHSISKFLLLAVCLPLLWAFDAAHAAEGLQKLRVAYAAITAAFSIPWIAKEAGIFQRHGLDVELVYIAAGSRAVQTLVGGSIDIAAIGGPAGETDFVGDHQNRHALAFEVFQHGQHFVFQFRIERASDFIAQQTTRFHC